MSNQMFVKSGPFLDHEVTFLDCFEKRGSLDRKVGTFVCLHSLCPDPWPLMRHSLLWPSCKSHLGYRKTPHDKSFASIRLAPPPSPSAATVNCARALHFHEILAGLYCHVRSLFLFLLTNLRLLSDSEAGLGVMHGDGGARSRLGATRIDEDRVRGAETNMLQSAPCVSVCVCVFVLVEVYREPRGTNYVSVCVSDMCERPCTFVLVRTLSRRRF